MTTMVNEIEWIQCDKCCKWRVLPPGLNPDDLPEPWFCLTEPFNGNCEMPEEGEMHTNSIRIECDKSVVACTANDAQRTSSSKPRAKNSRLLQKSIKNFFKKVKFDEAMQALRLSKLKNDDTLEGSNSATVVVNIVTAGFCRPRTRPRKP
ncbi:hypothetical protein M758_1G138300 [Ceratodon purpureus]|nr:hypothetical protein M758_1G138300 [Ceratodon purpureus]KAG0629901.1 hypothetical protein M758_1G138300 [Ceratodon purpureus]KAG0629902.1 hypothetical protein M758_1G138300 [Ceratodon purpureus]KAG0629903.1 hypothetical protein M758_1G138300 [Ceratodon purpureus]